MRGRGDMCKEMLELVPYAMNAVEVRRELTSGELEGDGDGDGDGEGAAPRVPEGCTLPPILEKYPKRPSS